MPKSYIIDEMSDPNYVTGSYRFSVYLALFLTLIALAQLAFIYYQYITQPIPEYFATTVDGQVIKLSDNAGTGEETRAVK